MAPFKSCRKFPHFIKKLDTLERNHTDGKITRLVSFPVCQQVEARAPIYPITHTRSPPSSSHRPQTPAAGGTTTPNEQLGPPGSAEPPPSRASGLFCGIS